MAIIHGFGNENCKNYFSSITVDGENAYVFTARVSAVPFNWEWPGHQRPLDQTEEAAFISFESDSSADVCVEPTNSDFTEKDVVIRPLSKKVKAVVKDGKIYFTLSAFGGYSVEIKGFHNALHVFYNPKKDFLAEAKVERSPENIIYFGAGEHHVGRLDVKSHTTVVLDGGAVVYGAICAFCETDVKIVGYGIIDGSEEKRHTDDKCILSDFDGVIFNDRNSVMKKLQSQKYNFSCMRLVLCDNVVTEGVILRDSPCWAFAITGCENITVDNVKTIGMWRYNTDGVDFVNCKNVIFKNSFLRNFDDCLVIKGIKGWHYKNPENILAENNVFWCDWGRAIEYGAETNAEEYKNIVVRDCDVIHGSWTNVDIQTHNNAEIHDCLFDDIRLEYNVKHLPFMFQSKEGEVYCGKENGGQPDSLGIPMYNVGCFSKDGKLGCVHDILFKNIAIIADEGVSKIGGSFFGIDQKHNIKNITIENLTYNGKKITSLDDANLDVSIFTENVVIK